MTEYQRRRDLQALAVADREAAAWAATLAAAADDAALLRLQRDDAEAAESAARQALGDAQRREPLAFGGDWEPMRGPLGAYQAYVQATAAADEARQALAVAEAPLAPAQRQLALWQGERARLRAESRTGSELEAPPLCTRVQTGNRLPSDDAATPAPTTSVSAGDVAAPLPTAPARRARLSFGPARWGWGARRD